MLVFITLLYQYFVLVYELHLTLTFCASAQPLSATVVAVYTARTKGE